MWSHSHLSLISDLALTQVEADFEINVGEGKLEEKTKTAFQWLSKLKESIVKLHNS